MATQPTTWLRQDKSLNPTGVINPATGFPYTYGPPAPVAPVVPLKSSFLSSNNNSQVVTPEEKPGQKTTRSKYINPETGKYFQTAEEYGNYVATKIPASKPAGDIPAYAGDAMTNPDKSVTDLQGDARNLNNARNDIAVGATDPYKVANKSGVAYSPDELKAIEKAYAGIYDPALNDVFARLKNKQASDEKAASEKVAADKAAISAAKGPTVKSGGLVVPESDVSKGQQLLESKRGDDGMGPGKGYYNSKDYIDMYNEWVTQHNALPADFFKYFKPNLNPNDPTIPPYIWSMIAQYGGNNSGGETQTP